MSDSAPNPISAEELLRCTRLLEQLATDSRNLSVLSEADRIRLLVAAGQVVRPDKHDVRRRLKDQRKARRAARHAADRGTRANTSIRAARLESVFVPAPQLTSGEILATGTAELVIPRYCYVCKETYTRLHHFYDALCPPCAALNYEKRFQTAPMPGQVALITGARLKIGYQASLMMLRAGARVIVTTRFPRDAALRYARERDFAEWGDRLQIHGLDLRHSPSVEAFCAYLDRTLDRLDVIINNAAQTVRRPPGFYHHMMETEGKLAADLPPEAAKLLRANDECRQTLLGRLPEETDAGTRWVADLNGVKVAQALGLVASAELSQLPSEGDETAADAGRSEAELFPEGKLDADLQQVDLRRLNSWRMRLADVSTAELLEVQLINTIAPYILCAKLKPLMLRNRTGAQHIVNVSAMEGKFARHTKTDKHPHTNMAKAALNMMTLTSARDYAEDGIFMNAVDTGWVTDEDPAELSQRKQRDHDFQPPLDIVDGAARVMDPVFSGLRTGKHVWGNFLKDYFPTEW